MVVPQNNPTKEELLKLMTDKDKLEQQIKEFGDILAQNKNVGLDGPLVDSEGFPRNDIDVYQVRQARQQIICLQNDYKTLMKEIEKLLHKLHTEAASDKSDEHLVNVGTNTEITDDSAGSSNAVRNPTLVVIAKVSLVSPGSPAEDAGISIGDEIIQFGSINSTNFNKNLTQIGDIVRHMENQRIPLKVKRSNQTLDMILIPKVWSGRGLLGCTIALPDAVDR